MALLNWYCRCSRSTVLPWQIVSVHHTYRSFYDCEVKVKCPTTWHWRNDCSACREGKGLHGSGRPCTYYFRCDKCMCLEILWSLLLMILEVGLQQVQKIKLWMRRRHSRVLWMTGPIPVGLSYKITRSEPTRSPTRYCGNLLFGVMNLWKSRDRLQQGLLTDRRTDRWTDRIPNIRNRLKSVNNKNIFCNPLNDPWDQANRV